MVRYCAVYGCLESNRTNKDRKFFRFPSNEQRCRHWVKAIGRVDLEHKAIHILHSSYFVCKLHFTDSDCLKKTLKVNAVPTLLLPQLEDPSGKTKYTQTDVEPTCSSCKSQCDLQIPNTSQSAQTSVILSEDTPGKRKLQHELNSEGKKRRLLESLIENVTDAKDSDMPPLLKKIIDAQKLLKRLYSQGNRYDQEYIMFALNVYFSSPVAYRFLSKTFCLPNIRTLQRHIAFSISTKFDENLIKCLESKCRNLSESEKYCIICADEVPLKRHIHYLISKDKVFGFHEINEKQTKEIATQALVVMARGIFSNWKQPLAFCFLGQSKNYAELNTWLGNIIAKMIKIGFNVRAFTSDQGSNFMNFAKNKSISTNKPFFSVNGKKIYYIFDVPHLTNSLRNNLMKYDFVYTDADGSKQVATWNDIKSVYDAEKDKNYKMAFKLTETHIKPNKFAKMHVKYATQVLSRTVAVTICTLVETGKLPEKSMGTTKFVELINDTFDILNSSTVNDDYKYKKVFQQADYQINMLKKVQHILSGLRVINRQNGKDVTNTMKFIKGFLISIKAISSLASDLKKVGYEYLFTRRLNQDSLETFVEKVRQCGGHYRELSAIQFYAGFRKLVVVNIIRHLEHANRAEDLDQLLMSVEQAQNSFRSGDNVSMESSERGLQVGTIDYRFELPKKHAFTFICGYLLKKCHDHHKDCVIMNNYIDSYVERNEQVDQNSLFTYFRAYIAYILDQPFGALINPPEDFKQYIKQIDSICEDHFVNGNFYHVGNEIMTKIGETVFVLPCPCFPLEYLNKLFVRLRIFNVMRHNNKNFMNKTFKGKYLSVSHL